MEEVQWIKKEMLMGTGHAGSGSDYGVIKHFKAGNDRQQLSIFVIEYAGSQFLPGAQLAVLLGVHINTLIKMTTDYSVPTVTIKLEKGCPWRNIANNINPSTRHLILIDLIASRFLVNKCKQVGYNDYFIFDKFLNDPSDENLLGILTTRSQTSHPDTYVYIMKAENRFKIGISTDITTRLTNLRNAVGLPIELIRSYGPFVKHRAYHLEQHILSKTGPGRGEWRERINISAIDDFVKNRKHQQSCY